MKVSKRDIGLLLGLFGVLLAVVAYCFVFNPTNDKIDALRSEISALKNREAELQDIEKNIPYYKEQMVLLQDEADLIVERFPAEIRPENEIMYAVELENQVEVAFSTLTYGSPVEILPDSGNTGLNAYNTPMSASYTATYDGLKNVIRYTAKQKNRMVVDTVTAAFDSATGNLAGSMTINMYTVTGTERIYESPYIPAMGIGLKNIFESFN